MKSNGNLSFYSINLNDENQTGKWPSPRTIIDFISLDSSPSAFSSTSRRPSVPLQITLRNPPIGRRLLNGINFSNTPSPTISPCEFFSSSQSKSSLFNHTPPTPDPPPIPPRTHPLHKQNINNIEEDLRRTRISRRKGFRHSRSDSADTLSPRASRQYSSEQSANSD